MYAPQMHIEGHPLPWLAALQENPELALERLLTGSAHLASLQRSSPSQALVAMFGDLDRNSPEWRSLDQALEAWLRVRFSVNRTEVDRYRGVECFITEASEGLRVAWRLALPQCLSYLRRAIPNLMIWASDFVVSETHDLKYQLGIAQEQIAKLTSEATSGNPRYLRRKALSR